MLSLIFIQIICTTFYSFLGKKKINNYIYYITHLYNNSNFFKEKNKKIFPKKKKVNYDEKNSINDNNKRNEKIEKSLNSSSINASSEILAKKFIKSTKKGNKKNILTLKSKIKEDSNKINSAIKINDNCGFEKMPIINIKDYLSTENDDMDFDDILEKDKRKFFQYLFHSIKLKHLVVNSFFVNDYIKPKSIKIFIFVLTNIFYFLFNGLYYREPYIIELYYIKDNESFFGFIPRTYERLLYTSYVTFIINTLIDWFIIEEKKIKGIFLRGKNKSQLEIKIEILI